MFSTFPWCRIAVATCLQLKPTDDDGNNSQTVDAGRGLERPRGVGMMTESQERACSGNAYARHYCWEAYVSTG